MLFQRLFTAAFLAITALYTDASPIVESRQVPCVILPNGQYTIALEATGWLLRPYFHARAPPAINSLEEAPEGQLGVWQITSAPQNAYFISNVGEGLNLPVATLNYGNAPQPYVAPEGVAPVAFAIQCAGNGTYVIKLPTADAVWTAPAGAWVKLFPANGSILQRFRFNSV